MDLTKGSAEGEDGGGGDAKNGNSNEVLADAAKRLQANVSWCETLGFYREEGKSSGRKLEVEAILALSASNGMFDASNVSVLAPVMNVFKELLEIRRGSLKTHYEVLELIQLCVGIATCLVKASRSTVTRAMALTCGEFKSEMEHVGWFVQAYDTQMRDCSQTAARHKRKLGGLLREVMTGFASSDLHVSAELLDSRSRLTFVSHAGEDKDFVRSLMKEIEAAKVPTFFDDDMVLGTPSVVEMESRAAEADQAIVVLSRPFLTKEWPMKELHIFLGKKIKICPLFYRVTPDELYSIMDISCLEAGDDKEGFIRKMEADLAAWRALMNTIGGSTRFEDSTSLPDPLSWRHDLRELAPLTGLRRQEFEEDESYAKATACIVSPPRLPDAVPSLPDHFVKPSLVDDVISALLDTTPPNRINGVVLAGLGGAGKTLIAVAVARAICGAGKSFISPAVVRGLRRNFNDGVLWLEDEPGDYQPQRFLVQLNTLAKQFKETVLSRFKAGKRASQDSFDDVEFSDLKDAQAYFPMWQKKFDLQCLLVIDSAWSLRVLEAAGNMGFRVLATSRKEDVTPGAPGWRCLQVSLMNHVESLFVLTKCSGALGDVPREAALQVAKDCAFLPLVLAIAGSMPIVADSPLSVDAWRQLHENLKDRSRFGQQTGAEHPSINTVLAFSVDELGREQKSRFLKLAVLSNGVPASKDMLCTLWRQDEADARVSAKDLVSRSLGQIRGDDFIVHDLLLDFVKAKIKDNRDVRKAAISLQALYLGRLPVLRGYSDKGETIGGFLSIMNVWRSLEELSNDPMLEMNTYQTSLGELKRSLPTLDIPKTNNVAQTLLAVARLFDLQGKFGEAELFYRRVQEVLKERVGEENSNYASALNNRAGLLIKQGKFDTAEDFLNQAIVIGKKIHGPDHLETVTKLNNLAGMLRKRGRYSEALQLLTEARRIREKVLGLEHPVVAQTLNEMAGVLEAQGMYSEAGPLFERSLEIRRKTQGDEHPAVATALSNWVGLLSSEGRYDEADKQYQRALLIDEAVYGPNHPEVATTLNNNGAVLLKRRGRYDEAEQILERALGIREKALGRHHPLVAETLDNLATVLQKKGQFAEADQFCERAITIVQETFGPNHPGLATNFNNRAQALNQLRRYGEADSLYARVLKILGATVGEEHRNYASALNNRAGSLRQQHETEGQTLCRTLIQCIRLTNESGLLSIFNGGKYAEALSLYKEALAKHEKALGPNHPALVTGLNNCAVMLKSQGEQSEAIRLWERALTLAKKLGENHPYTVAITRSLAHAREPQVACTG